MIPCDVTVPRRLAVVGALALVWTTLAACGSSSSSSTTQKTSGTGPPTTTSTTATSSAATAPVAPTKTEFIAKADAICKDARANKATSDEVEAAEAAIKANETAATRTRLAKAIRAAGKDATALKEKLQALEPPPAGRVTVSQYF